MRRICRALACVACASLIGLVGPGAFAQPAGPTKPAREAAALRFAKAHHPELAELLQRLKSADREAYQKALADVSQTSERLAKLKENDPARYELSLHVWTLDSRIRLLAARLTMHNDPGIEDELRSLLRERQQARLALLRLDRERLIARLERLDTQIAELEDDPTASVESDLARIKREIKNSAARERRGANRRPAPQAGAEPTSKPDKASKPKERGGR